MLFIVTSNHLTRRLKRLIRPVVCSPFISVSKCHQTRHHALVFDQGEESDKTLINGYSHGCPQEFLQRGPRGGGGRGTVVSFVKKLCNLIFSRKNIIFIMFYSFYGFKFDFQCNNYAILWLEYQVDIMSQHISPYFTWDRSLLV